MSLVRKRIVLPLIPTDIFQVIRPTQSKDAVLDLTYQQLLSALSDVFSEGGSLILLKTNGTDNPNQNILNLVEGDGITISDDGLGNITITSIGGGGTYTVDNGLSPDPADPNNFQLGGALTKMTTITAPAGTRLSVTSIAETPLFVKTTGTSGQYGINCQSENGPAGFFYSKSAPGISSATEGSSYSAAFKTSTQTMNNAVLPIVDILAYTIAYPTLDGFGASIDFRLATADFVNFKSSNKLISKWSTANDATRTSQFEITSVNNAGADTTTLTLKGTGQLQLNNYTGTTFDGTAVNALGVDSSGNVITFDGATGGLEYAIASGTNTYAVTIAGVTAYTDGDIYSIKFTNGNTAASTITINGITPAQHLHKSVSTSLASGDIISGQVLIIQYDGANFQVIGIAGGTGNLPAGGTANQVLTKIDSTNYNTQWADNISSIQHIQQYVKNNQGVPVSKGQAVYIDGADGTNATIKLAQADSELTSSKTLGLLEQDLNNNAKGFVITEGLLSGLDTSAATADGDPVWLSPTTPGGLVYGLAAKPYAPSHLVFIGIVIRKNASNGEIYVKVQNGFELKELHDVQAQSPASKDTLYFDNTVTPNQWKTAQASTLLPTSYSKGSCGVVFDGADGVITANTVAYVQVPYSGTITAWTIVSKPTAVGTCTVTAFKLSSYPPTTPTDNIFNTQPALTGTAFNQDLTPDFISGKDVVTAGDWIGFRITVPVTVTWVNLTLSITKT